VESTEGKPASGVQLRAFVWDGFRSPLGSSLRTNIDEYSFGELRGDTAVTDANGIATFSDLQLVGSSCRSIFINVTIGNSAYASLSSQVPIKVIPQVASVTIQNAPSHIVVTEGRPIPHIIRVLVTCSSATSCSNRRVYASLDSISGNRVRKVQFRSFLRSRPKILYNTSATTDSSGIALFPALQFSVDGRAGEFQISFVCDGVYSSSTLIGTFSRDGLPNLRMRRFASNTSYTYEDACGIPRRRVVSFSDGETPNVVNNVAGAVLVAMSFATSFSSQQTFGDKPVTVELTSNAPGVDLQISNTQIPIVAGSDGTFQVSFSFSPYVNGTYVNGSTVSLRISIDDAGRKVLVPFLFVVNQANCSSPLAIQASCPTGGFMSVFTGTFKAADMRTWTPWFPGNWSSSRPISLSFTLNSMSSISRASFVCNRNYSKLLVFSSPTTHLIHTTFSIRCLRCLY
jgi:hypothetical protein